jgi:SH3-like domain-containing protein
MGKRRLGSLFVAVACLSVAIGAAYSLLTHHPGSNVQAAAALQSSASRDAKELGPSGLPVPRFVSLKTDVVNVRRGPSNQHEVAWVFRHRALPVEIIAEFEHWRRIRDSDGEEGWVYQSLLAGTRSVIVEPWQKGITVALRSQPNASAVAIAMLKSGVIAEVKRCTGQWCELTVGNYQGWIDQDKLFGVYPGEDFDN